MTKRKKKKGKPKRNLWLAGEHRKYVSFQNSGLHQAKDWWWHILLITQFRQALTSLSAFSLTATVTSLRGCPWIDEYYWKRAKDIYTLRKFKKKILLKLQIFVVLFLTNFLIINNLRNSVPFILVSIIKIHTKYIVMGGDIVITCVCWDLLPGGLRDIKQKYI